MSDDIPWIEKYRPRELKYMTQSENLLNLFQNSVNTGNITHYLFYGPPGTGKTSAILAMGREIFREHFKTRVIEFNASDDRGIGAVREKITNEAKKYVSEIITDDGVRIPPYKIIILDEADSMTDEAQDALRVIVEQYSTVTRFCFICNYISKITDAIKSRCSAVYFKRLSDECIINKLNDIAIRENMNLGEDILRTVVTLSVGDMRKAIMLLQNIKYLYNFKKFVSKPISQMDIKELCTVKKINGINISDNSKNDRDVNVDDIYEISASITQKRSVSILEELKQCKKILNITLLCKNIISFGYPIYNIVVQLNQTILESDDIPDLKKAEIINYSGKNLYRMKHYADEYIQLVDYLTFVHKILVVRNDHISSSKSRS